MARLKKAEVAAKPAAEVKPKEKKIVLTTEQFKSMREASESISDARRILDNLEDGENISAFAFAAGKAYASINRAEDLIDSILNEFDYDDIWIDENF